MDPRFGNQILNSKKNHKKLRKFIMNLILDSRNIKQIYSQFAIYNNKNLLFFLSSISLSRIHHCFTIFSRIYYRFTIGFVNRLSMHYLLRKLRWINYLFRKFTLNFLFALRIHFEFTIDFANSLSIHYLLREFTMNSLSTSWIHFQFTIYFANSLLIPYLLRDITFNWKSLWQIH